MCYKRKSKIILYIALSLSIFIFFLITSCSDSGSNNNFASTTFSPEVREKMEKIIDTYLELYEIPGAVAGVFVPGEGTWVSARGKSCIETGENMGIDKTFRIGSITKTFTTTVLLQLVDEGRLNLEDSLESFIPYVPDSNNISIRQLCNNTSGLFRYDMDEKFNEIVMKDDFLTSFSPEELVDFAISHEPYFPPGQGFEYSNTNFVLQGMIIEKITGNKVEDEIQNRIIKPLGLRNTSFPKDIYMTGDYAGGYMYDVETGETIEASLMNPSITWAAGGMISNMKDLTIWAEALAEGYLLKENTQKERLQWSTHSVQGMFRYGLGIMYYWDFASHDGATVGYNSSMYYLPARKATIVILLNHENNAMIASFIFLKIACLVLPDYTPLEKKSDPGKIENPVH